MMDDALAAFVAWLRARTVNPILQEADYCRPETTPPGYHSAHDWQDRGYKPRRGERPRVVRVPYSTTVTPFAEKILEYATQSWDLTLLYSFEQCRKIRGKAAQQRRDAYHAATGTVEPQDRITGNEPMLSRKDDPDP